MTFFFKDTQRRHGLPMLEGVSITTRTPMRLRLLHQHTAAAACYVPTTATAAAGGGGASLGVALMGYGAIGKPVAAALLGGTHGLGRDSGCPCHLAAVLVSSTRPRPPELPESVVWTTDPDDFFEAEWVLCAEGAG